MRRVLILHGAACAVCVSTVEEVWVSLKVHRWLQEGQQAIQNLLVFLACKYLFTYCTLNEVGKQGWGYVLGEQQQSALDELSSQYHSKWLSVRLNNRLTMIDDNFCSVDQIQGLQAKRGTAAW